MTREVSLAAQACEHAFQFLVDEFAYRFSGARFDRGGFALRYLGATLGIEVDWYPRDTLTVWLVRLVDGEFPKRVLTVHPDSRLNHFDLEDLEVVSGHARDVGELQLYATPNAENAQLLANSLRTYAADLLRGDLTRLSQLERRILERGRTLAIERYGEEGAARLGW